MFEWYTWVVLILGLGAIAGLVIVRKKQQAGGK